MTDPDVLKISGIEMRLRQGSARGHRAQLGGMQVLEAAAVPADGGAGCTEDND
jgi:hypothetical protein